MFCMKCGKKLPDDARFCPACGTPTVNLDAVASTPQPQPAQPQAVPFQQPEQASDQQLVVGIPLNPQPRLEPQTIPQAQPQAIPQAQPQPVVPQFQSQPVPQAQVQAAAPQVQPQVQPVVPQPQPQVQVAAPQVQPQPNAFQAIQPVMPDPSVPLGERTIVHNGDNRRTTITVRVAGPMQPALAAVEQILTKANFGLHDYEGESVWKKGTGFATAMKYIKLMPLQGNLLMIQGWVKVGMADKGLHEMSLEGILAAIPKKTVNDTIDKIIEAVTKQ